MNHESNPAIPPAPRSLASLHAVPLNAHSQRLLNLAQQTNGGPTPWQTRKLNEARDLIALSQVSNRYRIEWLDLFDPLRLLVAMKVPVPCLPDPHGPLQIAQWAHIGLTYRAAAVRTAQPGTSFVEILSPRHVWLPNVTSDPTGPQILCLGPSLPAGVRTRDILFMVFGALTLQTVQMDALDPAGVLSREAAEWWQQRDNLKRVPLTREPFLSEPELKP
jgi:hypothetical protein